MGPTMSQRQYSKPIKVKKQKFDSITEAAKHFDVPLSTAARRLQKGWTPEQALNLTPPPKKVVAKKAGAKKAVNQKTANEAEQSNGRRKTLAIQTRGRKSQVAKSVAAKKKSMQKQTITQAPYRRSIEFNGKKYASISELARSLGVPRHAVQNAVTRGLDLEATLLPKKAKPTPKNKLKTKTKTKNAQSAVKRKRNNPVVFKGDQYESERALSAAFNVPHATFYQRMKRGWSMEEALGLSDKKAGHRTSESRPARGKPVVINGETYPSIKAAADAHGLPSYRVIQRLKHGWSQEEAFGIKERKRKTNTSAIKVIYDGQEFPSVGAFCRKYSLTPQHVSYHMKKGRSPEEIVERLTTPRNPVKSIQELAPFVVEGQTFNSASQLARHYGMNIPKVTGRLRNGWSAEEAVGLIERGKANKPSQTKSQTQTKKIKPPVKTAPKNQGTRVLFANGKRYSSIKSAARDLNLDYPTLLKRSKENKPFSVIVAELQGKKGKVRTSGKLTPEEMIVDGKQYASLSEIAREHQVPYQKLRGYIQKGLSAHEAVSELSIKQEPSERPPVSHKYGPVQYGADAYKDVEEFSAVFDLDPIVVERRLSAGWSAEQILGAGVPPNWD